MTEQRVLELLAAGVFTQVEADAMIVDIRRREAAIAEANKAEEFLAKLEAAPIHTVKRMVKQKAAVMQVRASLMDDSFEAKAKRKKAYNLSRSIRGIGGVSFD